MPQACRRPAAGVCRRGHAVKGQADFRGKHQRRRRCHHTPPGTHEQPPAEPVLQPGNLPADRTMRQAQFGRGFRIAGGAGRDLENAKGIERGQAAHENP